MLIASGSWGLYWLPQRFLMEQGFSGGWGTIAQYLISMAFLLPFALWRLIRRREIGLQYWVSGLLLGSGAIFYANSFLYTEVIRALIFFYLTPLWATLFEVFFLKRALNKSRVWSIILSVIGVWIAVGLDVGVPIPIMLGDWFGLLGGLLISAGAVRSEMEQPNGVFPLLFIVVSFCLLMSLCHYPFLTEKVGVIPSLEIIIVNLPSMIAIAVLFVIPTTAILFWSPSRIGAGVFGILILMELVVGVVSAAILTDESFGLREVFGVSLIVIASVVEIKFNNPNRHSQLENGK